MKINSQGGPAARPDSNLLLLRKAQQYLFQQNTTFSEHLHTFCSLLSS